jgi:hypothetical protein
VAIVVLPIPREWIAILRPQVVLLSVAGGDALDLPLPETLEAMQGVYAAQDGFKCEDLPEHRWGVGVDGIGALVPGGMVAPSREG